MSLVEGAVAVGCHQNLSFVLQISDLIGLIEIGNLLTWGALLLATIAAIGTLIKTSGLPFLRLSADKSSVSKPMFFENDDAWSSCSSDGESAEDEDVSSVEEEEDEREDYSEDEWQWSRPDLWLAGLGSGRDEVVKSWGEEERPLGVALGFGEDSVWKRRRGKEVVKSFEIPAMLRRRVMDLGSRGEEKLVYLRSAADLALAGEIGNQRWRFGRLSAAVVEDGGSLEATVVSWCRNAASCFPIISPNE